MNEPLLYTPLCDRLGIDVPIISVDTGRPLTIASTKRRTYVP